MNKSVFVFLSCLVFAGMLVSTVFGATGPYLSLQGGATWLADSEITYDGVPSSAFSLETEFDTGFNAGVSVGYDFGTGRLEGEVVYRRNDADIITGQALGIPFEFSTDGDVCSSAFILNGFWDVETGGAVTPYLGAGIGVARISVNDLEDDVGDPLIDDDDTVLAYQFAAGIGFELAPSVVLDMGYRYFATDDPELTDVYGDGLEAEYESHNASLGLRFAF